MSADLRRRLAWDPQAREAWRPLAFAFAACNEFAAAAAIVARLAALRPEALDLSNLAELRRAAGLGAAARSARRALALDPALAAAHNNLGNIVLKEDRPAEGETAFRRALTLQPAFRDAAYNLAAARNDQGDPLGAIEIYDRVIAKAPDFFQAHWNRALALLAAGRWQEGWQAHEIRRLHPLLKPRDIPIPDWTGEPLAGRTLLVLAEQGHGDSLQFLRFVPALARLGARVTLDLPAPLLRLARSLPGVERLIESGTPPGDVDLTVPLMSLPLRLRLGERAAAPVAPYLVPPPLVPPAVARDGRPLVGLVWAGSPGNQSDARRSLTLDRLGPVLALKGLRFVSLQFGPRAADIAASGAASRLETLEDLGDFATTAALVASLDLVVTVDTAMAHLAGAIGHEAWVLLAHAPDWRWGTRGETTSWYPSLRLFRQPGPGDWDGVVRTLVRALARRFPEAGRR